MNRLLLFFSLNIIGLHFYGQGKNDLSIHYYIEAAKANSPLIADFRNQSEIEQAELERLKAMYTHSRLELNGDYLFVPVVSKDGGHAEFKWNARSATDYYGYDLGESSGSFHTVLTWTQPLILGKTSYKVAQGQAKVNTDIAHNRTRMEEHQLERSVTEQYLLCLLDKAQIDYTDSVSAVIERQTHIVRKLVENGFSKQSDLNLLAIEREANMELLTAFRRYYRRRLARTSITHTMAGERQIQPLHRTIPVRQSEHIPFPAFFQPAIQAQIGFVHKRRIAGRRLCRMVSAFRMECRTDILMDNLRRQTKTLERASGTVATRKHSDLQGKLRIPKKHEGKAMLIRTAPIRPKGKNSGKPDCRV